MVQKHEAHRAGLHWDFRLEHDGVLWSWAVRKGPSLDPADKRIAAHVEDHPLDYADFQGTIPDGQYGAGTVETWDRGTWEPLDDPDEGMRKGELKFVLHGKRLHGRFTLVRLKPQPASAARQDNWLLIKGHDEAERAGADAPRDRSSRSPPPEANRGKQREDAPAKGAVRGKLPQRAGAAARVGRRRAARGRGLAQRDQVRRLPPAGWLDHGKVRLITRNGHDWTDRLPAVARAVGRLSVETALVDGELVALEQERRVELPRAAGGAVGGPGRTLYLYLFDLLHLDGWDLRACALLDRKGVLRRPRATGTACCASATTTRATPPACAARPAGMGLEGIICKQADAPYRAGRGHGWLKVKCRGREEFVVLGWTPPGGSRTGLARCISAITIRKGKLHYAGGVGTGFSDDELGALRERLAELAPRSAEGLLVVAGDPLRTTIHWVRAGAGGRGAVRRLVRLGPGAARGVPRAARGQGGGGGGA